MRQRYCKPARPTQLALCARRATAVPMSSSLRLLLATDGRPHFFAERRDFSIEPAGHYQIIQPLSLNRCPLESGYENKGMPFCSGTERRDRWAGTERPGTTKYSLLSHALYKR